MKITTYIDEKLLKSAIRETGSHSQREAIETGLIQLLSDVRRKRFVKEFASLRPGFDLKTLRKSRA